MNSTHAGTYMEVEWELPTADYQASAQRGGELVLGLLRYGAGYVLACVAICVCLISTSLELMLMVLCCIASCMMI